MAYYPHMFLIKQTLLADTVTDPEGLACAELTRVLPPLKRGAPVAVTAGSRGIAAIVPILRGVCSALRHAGARPFLVPAMGSHGGATASGQEALLAALGITEESVGAPVRATMETVFLGETAEGTAVYMDRYAAEAAGIVVVARVKHHTDFTGQWESGLAKMLAIGLGKETGARYLHSFGAAGLRRLIPAAAAAIIAQGRVLAGIAILENAVGGVWQIAGVKAHEILPKEADLLALKKTSAPRLPFSEADVLLVDYIGKDISGTGMDTRVIGRMRIPGEPEPERPRIGLVAALDLSETSHGNANGVGLADVITERLSCKIDHLALRANAAACGFWERAKVPVAFPTDQEAIEACLASCGRPTGEVRLCRIRDTMHLEYIAVSEALLPSLEGSCAVVGRYELLFDELGNLSDHHHFGTQLMFSASNSSTGG